ncbi:MAG: translation initiation factor IF-2 N-terminal domain-containing protein [Corynebacterium sp.]|uniref:translation initiation factor IF-2 N-terminal domain-containing protein n=1 Tax=Corynebacterium sp. TaxID=1720 RepID=UPI0026DA95DF|nr:translation initiation factor IF-2 N-terminal domain-containing protein [Corynebacterium sp.]MDO5099456.1 translation initiation factor IF-2 N-terminal domain-containing protein [Corynebacterium sp.]
MADITTFDRSALGEKTRVHVLAKNVGLSSKELIAALADIGLKKVAQSNLSREEAEKVLDALAAAPVPEEETYTDEEKLRYRVEKNVENEINQIEQKVERELAEQTGEPLAETEDDEKIRHRVEKNVENEINQIEQKVQQDIADRLDRGLLSESDSDTNAPGTTATDAAATDVDAADSDPADAPESITQAASAPDFSLIDDEEEDLVPVITPAPRTVGFSMPLFVAPTVDSNDDDDYDMEYYGSAEDEDDATDDSAPRKRRRGRRGTGRGAGKPEPVDEDDQPISEPLALKGSTRLEAQRRRRVEMREESRKKRHIVSEAEFLARRESVNRVMVVRERERTDHPGMVTQVGVLEDDMLVEHFVTSDTQSSMVGNIYLGRVQNVLASMEAAFIDIGKGRNGVLYAGEVDWRAAGLGGRNRKIEQALKSGDQVLVQVAKDPVGQKGARLTTQISLAGRYLVYVPGGKSAGISRKLPAPERKRLKSILRDVVPNDGGVIIRTAAEGVSEEAIAADVNRLHNLWEQIQERTSKEKESKGAKPVTMYEEPNMLVKVIRDLFNEDFSALIVDGKRAWNTVHAYIQSVAPDLLSRLQRFDRSEHDGQDAFMVHRVDEQLKKALSRKVWLPSGGTLVIDRTEAMTVIDVNTGKFTGQGGNLEETVTKNNLEAAEEIVRQMRLRDLGGMIVVDFIDMVLPENQDLVLRRLTEALGRDRTRHQISEVTSLGLVQMTRKRLGTGLLETFATECEECGGRGVLIHEDPVEQRDPAAPRGKHGVLHQDPTRHPAVVAMHTADDKEDGIEEAEPEVSAKPERETETPSIEELAAAVIALPEEPEGTKKKASKSRATKADEALADVGPDTYEQALAEFEKSPRRKRKTRGNSVSDVRPRPEDFQTKPAATEPPAVQEDSDPEPQATAVSQVEESPHGRKRRRAVRKNAPETAPVERRQATGGKRRRIVRKSATRAVHDGEVSQQKPQSDPEPTSADATPRGRRRAVRRGTRK